MKNVNFLKTSLKYGVLSSNLLNFNAMNIYNKNIYRKYDNHLRIESKNEKKNFIKSKFRTENKYGFKFNKNILVNHINFKKEYNTDYFDITEKISAEKINKLKYINSGEYLRKQREKQENELNKNFESHKNKIIKYYEILERYLRRDKLKAIEDTDSEDIKKLITLLNYRYKKIFNDINKLFKIYNINEKIDNINTGNKFNKKCESFLEGINYVIEKEKNFCEKIKNNSVNNTFIRIKLKENEFSINNIKSVFFIRKVLSYLSKHKKLELVRYNKALQEKAEIKISDYKKEYDEINKPYKDYITEDYNNYCLTSSDTVELEHLIFNGLKFDWKYNDSSSTFKFK